MQFLIVTLLTIRSSAHSKHVAASLFTKVTYAVLFICSLAISIV